MWRLRDKQLELDNKLRGIRRESNSGRSHKDIRESRTSTSRASDEVDNSANSSRSSKKRDHLDPLEDEGLKDAEIDQFLHSRIKRGRGSVGSRMDETGPYLPLSPDSKNKFDSDNETIPYKARVALGPEKPYSLKSSELSSDDEPRPHKNKKASSKRHSRKDKSKAVSKDKKKKKRKEKRSKHHK